MNDSGSSINLVALPTEILVHILDVTDTASVAKVCRCSKFLLSVAQPILYNHVFIHRSSIKGYDRVVLYEAEPELYHLREVLTHLLRNPKLAGLCRRLTVLPTTPPLSTGQLVRLSKPRHSPWHLPPVAEELLNAIEWLALPGERNLWQDIANRLYVGGEGVLLAILILILPKLESIEINFDSDGLPKLHQIISRTMARHLTKSTDITQENFPLKYLREVKLTCRADGGTAWADGNAIVHWFGFDSMESITLSRFETSRSRLPSAIAFDDVVDQGTDHQGEDEGEAEGEPAVEDYEHYEESDANDDVPAPCASDVGFSLGRAPTFKEAPRGWSKVKEINLHSGRFRPELLDGILRSPRALRSFTLSVSYDSKGWSPFSIKQLHKSLKHQRASLRSLRLDRSEDLIFGDSLGRRFVLDNHWLSDYNPMPSLSKFTMLKVLDVASMFVKGIGTKSKWTTLQPWYLVPGAADWNPSLLNEAEEEWFARWLPRPNLEILILRNCDDSMDETRLMSFVQMFLRILKQHRTGEGSWFKPSPWRESTKDDFAHLRRIELHGQAWCDDKYDYPKLVQSASEVPDLELIITGVYDNAQRSQELGMGITDS